MTDFKSFMATDAGASARYKQRHRRRIHITIDDIEPQSKKMSPKDRFAFQSAVAEQLSEIKRGTFRGYIALKLDLATSSKSPPHAHTIAKNLLDLLGKRMDGIDWPKKSLLYADDSQIQALSVSCRHGEGRPNIRIEARPFSAVLDDLELAAEALRAAESMESYHERDREGEWIDTFRDLIRDEAQERKALGDKLYEAYRKMVRWSAQRAVLGRSGVNIPVLGWMYGLPRGLPTGFDKGMCGPAWSVNRNSGSKSASCRSRLVDRPFSGRRWRARSLPSKRAGIGSSTHWLSPWHLKSWFDLIRRPHPRFCMTSTTSSETTSFPASFPPLAPSRTIVGRLTSANCARATQNLRTVGVLIQRRRPEQGTV